jgi:antitoxin (DNA-binding transcriptional repressor) of toxin-antitoxin stability system
MKAVTIREVRHRWPETEKALAREGEILITRDAKPVAKLVRVDTLPESRARFDPEQHAEWQRRVAGRRATRWVDAALAEQRSDRPTQRGRRRG